MIQNRNNMLSNALGNIGDQQYSQGLQNANQGGNDGEWKLMSSAPRDGTPIEVRCTYGVAPWYGLFFWTNKMTVQGQEMNCQQFRWAKVGDESSGFDEGESFRWRAAPCLGNGPYVDPTNGAQDNPQYWRDAVTRKTGWNFW